MYWYIIISNNNIAKEVEDVDSSLEDLSDGNYLNSKYKLLYIY